MINKELLDPKSIVVVGGSNDISKLGGKVLKNIVDGGFKGNLYVVNPKETQVQGIKCFRDVAFLPPTDLAVLAIAAKHCPGAVETLAHQKHTRGFIILSGGFSEEGFEGAKLEKQIVDTINGVNGALIGPNCIGLLTPTHHSIFTQPIPTLESFGVDFISSSGGTASFILEAAIPKGLVFASVFSVGNSAQIGVEDVLEYMDESFDPTTSSRIKLLYIENISHPQKLLKHARSLVAKGCRIAAIKAGVSEAGIRAASSHTGAIATPDFAVNTLLRKAGIVRCYGREDLIAVASVFASKPLTGKNIAVITHAGGPAVMLTDVLSQGGLVVPHIEGPAANELIQHLFPGSSVANPIDFLATATAEQLGIIMDFADQRFDNIDAMVVIFGTPGLARIFDVYDVLHRKINSCRKPVFSVLPSTLTAHEEIQEFISKGHVYFSDEVVLGNALARVYATPQPMNHVPGHAKVDSLAIRRLVDAAPGAYLSPENVEALLDAAGIPRASEKVVNSCEDAVKAAIDLGLPLAMKAVGPLHKSDKGGVILNVNDFPSVENNFNKLIKIEGASAVILQPMLYGQELFVGVKHEPGFGHMIVCGLGGIFIEVLRDINASFVPVSKKEALDMIHRLKGYKLFEGVRGRPGINVEIFADIILRLSALVEVAPEIVELDINPLLGLPEQVVAVDARILLEKPLP
ncbi:MAG: acetate--CoA ligase family protein [Bacteroidales bacterium]|nr:acetate--CoA ligase family protein [Bacteroidales bacterium]